MPYHNPNNGLSLTDGLYLLVQKNTEKGVDHYGILDVGNRLNVPNIPHASQPIVVHQTPPTIRLDWLQNTGMWDLMEQITDEVLAKQRIEHASQNPEYSLFGNNCEHFARFVAKGVRESTQVQTAVFLTGLAALTIWAMKQK